MAIVRSTLLVSFFVCFSYYTSPVSGNPQIVAPYPDNLHAIEDEKAQVSCTVRDSAGAKPSKIHFFRISRFGDTKLILDEGKDGRLHYVNVTSDGGKTLKVTLQFNKVKFEDDSHYAGYECHGYVGGKSGSYGFTVNVIRRDELPTIVISKNRTISIGENMTLSCNITQLRHSTKLEKVMWVKDGKVIHEVLYPTGPSLTSIVIKVKDTSEGGLYTCNLISKLRGVKEYKSTGTVAITVYSKDDGALTNGSAKFQLSSLFHILLYLTLLETKALFS